MRLLLILCMLSLFISCNTPKYKVIKKEVYKNISFYEQHCLRDSLIMLQFENLIDKNNGNFPTKNDVEAKFLNSDIMNRLFSDSTILSLRIVFADGSSMNNHLIYRQEREITFTYDTQLSRKHFNYLSYGPFIDLGYVGFIENDSIIPAYGVSKTNWVNEKYNFDITYYIVYKSNEYFLNNLRQMKKLSPPDKFELREIH
jgi:hypothetical protein